MISKLFKPGIPLAETYTNPPELDTDSYVSFTGSYEQCCVGLVDMADSTKISATIGGKKVCMLYGTFLNSMASVVRSFGGTVVKNIGDSILYYFAPSDSLGEFRRCLECSIAMVRLREKMNRRLEEMDLPSISYRVSADYGTVMIGKSQDSTCVDIFGPPVNMCAKINGKAEKNSAIIGGDLYEMAKKLKGYRFHPASGYSIGFKLEYPIYLLSC